MFYTKYIKNKPILDGILIFISNIVLRVIKLIRPRYQANNKNVVILSLHRLGDAVFTISAIKKIVKHHKENIYLVCYQETIPIYNLVFNSLKYVRISRNDFRFRIATRNARKKIKDLNPYIIYDFTGKIYSVSLFFNSSAKEIVGCNDPHFKSIYTKFVPLRNEPHITDIYLDAISPIIPDRTPEQYTLKSEFNGNYILIHPFASYTAKEWGLRNFIRLSEVINQKTRCVLVSQPGKIPSDVLVDINDKNIIIKETKSVDDLIDVIKKCKLFIGNDSGPVHIANLLGKPSFTIYGPTNPEYHKPHYGINEFARKKLKCSPGNNEKICFTHGGVFCPTYDCTLNLSFDEIKNQVLSFIEKNNIN